MFVAVKYAFEFELTLSVLRQHMQHQRQVIESNFENEELELFYRRIKATNQDVPFMENEIFNDVLEKVM